MIDLVFPHLVSLNLPISSSRSFRTLHLYRREVRPFRFVLARIVKAGLQILGSCCMFGVDGSENGEQPIERVRFRPK
jgi:hypothetical protein